MSSATPVAATTAPPPLASGWAPPAPGALSPAVPGPRPSAHAGGRYLARIFSSKAERYRVGEPAPAGAVTCEELQEAEGGAPGPTLCMLQEADGPRFGVQLPGQEGWHREGSLEECAGCHGTSPRGGWLGP